MKAKQPAAKQSTGGAKQRTRAAPAVSPSAPPPTPTDEQIAYSNLSLHDLFSQQTRQMLDRADLDEEQQQTILLAMSCSCCGAGGMSFTAKLNPKKRRSR